MRPMPTDGSFRKGFADGNTGTKKSLIISCSVQIEAYLNAAEACGLYWR